MSKLTRNPHRQGVHVHLGGDHEETERYENHAIYDTKSPRKKPKPKLTESQIETFKYCESLRRTVASRMRIAR